MPEEKDQIKGDDGKADARRQQGIGLDEIQDMREVAAHRDASDKKQGGVNQRRQGDTETALLLRVMNGSGHQQHSGVDAGDELAQDEGEKLPLQDKIMKLMITFLVHCPAEPGAAVHFVPKNPAYLHESDGGDDDASQKGEIDDPLIPKPHGARHYTAKEQHHMAGIGRKK